MRIKIDPQMSAIQSQLNSSTVRASLPRLEDLPECRRRELIQTLASMLMQEPVLQALLPQGTVRHEPE
jgi:hypothetical protein